MTTYMSPKRAEKETVKSLLNRCDDYLEVIARQSREISTLQALLKESSLGMAGKIEAAYVYLENQELKAKLSFCGECA